MIDWQRKAKLLAALVTDGDLRAVQVAVGCQKLLDMEQETREMFWTWHRHQGTRDEREEVYNQYIDLIRAEQSWSNELDRIGGIK